jgi:hypothetical protein
METGMLSKINANMNRKKFVIKVCRRKLLFQTDTNTVKTKEMETILLFNLFSQFGE